MPTAADPGPQLLSRLHDIATTIPDGSLGVSVFDYLSGRVPLAPSVWRRLGLEWLYRLIKQPWRWRRILRVFHFGALVLIEAVRQRIHK